MGKSSSSAPEALLKGPAFEQRQEGTHEAMTEGHLGRWKGSMQNQSGDKHTMGARSEDDTCAPNAHRGLLVEAHGWTNARSEALLDVGIGSQLFHMLALCP